MFSNSPLEKLRGGGLRWGVDLYFSLSLHPKRIWDDDQKNTFQENDQVEYHRESVKSRKGNFSRQVP